MTAAYSPTRFLSALGVVSETRTDPVVAARLQAAFRETERSGLMLASIVRVVLILSMVGVFAITGAYAGNGVTFLLLAPLGVAAIGLAQYESIRRWPEAVWAKYVFVAIDCAYVAAILILRHDWASDLPPVTLAVKEGGLLFFIAFLVLGAFGYSPRFIIWTGLCVTVAWGVVLGMAAAQPGAFFVLPIAPTDTSDTMWRRYGDPYYLPIIKIAYDYVIIAVLTAGLAVAVWRSRQLVSASAMAERARANLARHFSPQMIDLLSARDRPFEQVCWQASAVLFADIRHFTMHCETMAPEAAIALLRQFHTRMEACIFKHDGTIDKILGDGLLAVFGVPEEGPHDASNAMCCAFAMLDAIAAWNEERLPAGQFPVQIGIGLHYGHVMLGDVGSERLMTFTVVGDTVNVASRLEALTRDLETDIVASDALVEAVRGEGGSQTALLDKLKPAGSQRLRERQGEIRVFALRPA